MIWLSVKISRFNVGTLKHENGLLTEYKKLRKRRLRIIKLLGSDQYGKMLITKDKEGL